MSDFCNVKNRSASVVVYNIPEDGIRRSFAPGETKKISYQELEKLTYQAGGMNILTRFLQVQSDDVIKSFNMKVEPEYYMSEKDVANVMMSGSLDAFLDMLDFAPVAVIDLVKDMSVKLPLVDMAKRKALKEKTGFDVDAALKHIEEDKEDEQGTILKQAGERRVKTEEVPAGRRTAPKDNIISKPAETTSAE